MQREYKPRPGLVRSPRDGGESVDVADRHRDGGGIATLHGAVGKQRPSYGKLVVHSRAKLMYGYTFSEQDPESLKIDRENIKPSLKIGKCRVKKDLGVKPNPVAKTLPIHFDFSLPRPDRDNSENVVIAQLKRIGTKPPKAHAIILKALGIFTQGFCERYLEPLTDEDVDFEKWIDQINQPTERKNEIRKVWNAAAYDDPAIVYKATSVKGFLKDEPNVDYKAARGINARSDWFKAFSGPYFDAIGKRVFAMPWFIKTIPVLDRPTAILEKLFQDLAATRNNDATSYEAHFEARVMEACEFVLYRYMTRASPALSKRMETIMAVLSAPQILEFKNINVEIAGLRCSGEMNTSLGNGFTTLLLNLFVAHLKKTHVELFAEGDDNLSQWIEAYKAPTAEEWKELGWWMKVETPRMPALASFCGNVFTPDDMVVVTDPRPALANFGWTNSRYVRAARPLLLQLLRSKALSMLHQYNGCPILGVFARRVEMLTRSVRIRASIVNTMEQYKRDQLKLAINTAIPPYKEPGISTRVLVEELYNIPIADQMALEASFEKLQLDTRIEFEFVMPPCWKQHYEIYTEWEGEEWQLSLPKDEIRLERFIRSFGRATKKFCESHYSSVSGN